MNLKLVPFERAHFPEYKSWYKDVELNTHLGPMDDEWLEHVLDDEHGCEYSVVQEEKMVAVVGITFPVPDHPYYFLTDLAVHPNSRGTGIGSKALQLLMQKFPLQEGETWRVVINQQNTKAQSFFEKNGWQLISNEPDEHGMLMFMFS